MSKRKLIGLITAVPESIHAKKVFEGVFRQCDKYGYNVAVFAPLAHLSGENSDYIKGELNIYELINFELLDGVVIDTISLIENNDETITNYILQRLEKECKCPVVSLNLPLGNYPMVQSSDEPIFREITEHVLDVHKVTDICFLTGPQAYPISEERLEVFKEVMKERGLTVKPEQVFYGDFWYTSGTSLAERMLAGEIPVPKAVICASDHMAIGLARRLAKGGVRIPQDVIITGFEATQEAALNEISITSFESNAVKTAAKSVNYLRSQMEQGEEIYDIVVEKTSHIHAGMSCGCEPDFIHSTRAFQDSFYYIYHDYSLEEKFDNINIGQLMEGYIAERLAESETPEQCLRNIYQSTFYLRPYTKFYLCLKEDWLDLDSVIVSGYPKKMKLAVHNTPAPDTGFCEDEKAIVFDTKLMLPQLFEEEDEPSVYYFSAVHFKDKMIGYSVLQRALPEKRKINLVYRNWLRHVNNSLEMTQTKNRLLKLSECDEMTGAYNRRGMDVILPQMLSNAKEGDYLFVGVVDMDGLKYVNDTFGHTEGDFAIKQVHKALLMATNPEEICVRAGGDEFYLFGVGQYTDADVNKHQEDFQAYLDKVNETAGKPYLIGASIGIELALIDDSLEVESVINAADVKMYASKVLRKKQRV